MATKISDKTKITLSISQIKQLVKESIGGTSDMVDDQMLGETAEDDWLEGYLKKNPTALDKTLEWINKTKPSMSDAGKQAWARNILKKKYREGKIAGETPPEGASAPASSSSSSSSSKGKDDLADYASTSPTAKEIRTATPEDEERFANEIDFYANSRYGNHEKKKPVDWWLHEEGATHKKSQVDNGTAKVLYFKPVAFDADGKVLLDVFLAKKTHSEYNSDGDYDDGRLHSWTDLHIEYTVDPSTKVGEAVGEIKDKKVVLSNGKILTGWSSKTSWSFRIKDKWSSAHRDYYSTGGNHYYGRRRYWQE